jgi:hypothetical protein
MVDSRNNGNGLVSNLFISRTSSVRRLKGPVEASRTSEASIKLTTDGENRNGVGGNLLVSDVRSHQYESFVRVLHV